MDKYVYFSATNTTERVMEILGADSSAVNVTKQEPSAEKLSFSVGDVLYIGFPVFGGRVPELVLRRLASLQGNGCKTVVVAVYGNRHYDDSIKEMQAFAEAHGCRVVGAIAAVAQHSIVPTVGTGRPDAADAACLREIKQEIDRRNAAGELTALLPRGEEAYMQYNPLPVNPITADDCAECGTCAAECPVDAISPDDPRVTDKEKCILCMRCVAMCPTGARRLPAEVQQVVTARLESRASVRRETEMLWII